MLVIRRSVVAGVIGGIVIDAYLTLVMPSHSPIAIWQFIASTIVGPVAFSTPSYALLGLCVHFIVSIVWAVLYAYAFGSLGQLRNWILGAIVWGIVVDAGMSLLLTIKTGSPWWASFVHSLLAHVVFYALPVALYMAFAPRAEPNRSMT